jgi:hypothetical protein
MQSVLDDALSCPHPALRRRPKVALWLFFFGLLGLLGITRKIKKA